MYNKQNSSRDKGDSNREGAAGTTSCEGLKNENKRTTKERKKFFGKFENQLERN